jgi:hypothetical protein
MELNIDTLISFFKKNTKSSEKEEFTEQESAPAGGSAGGTTGGAAMPKWEDVVGGPKRGKANMLGKKGEKWETGLTRGVANQKW